MTLRYSLKQLMELLVPFASQENFPHCDSYIVIFEISSCMKVLNFEKSCAPIFMIESHVSLWGIKINLHLYKDRFFVNNCFRVIVSIITSFT